MSRAEARRAWLHAAFGVDSITDVLINAALIGAWATATLAAYVLW